MAGSHLPQAQLPQNEKHLLALTLPRLVKDVGSGGSGEPQTRDMPGLCLYIEPQTRDSWSM